MPKDGERFTEASADPLHDVRDTATRHHDRLRASADPGGAISSREPLQAERDQLDHEPVHQPR